MKKGLFALLAVLLVTSCGGGGGGDGPTPTPTSDGTKAVTQAVSSEAMSAAGQGTMNGFATMAPVAMVVKIAAEKTNYAGNILTTVNCENGGTIDVTGNITASCTGTAETDWSCNNMVSNMNLVFTNCDRLVTLNSTTYHVIMNGTGTATMTGTASGVAETIALATFSGTLTGTPVITGDLNGTVDLSDLAFSGTVEGEAEPAITCEGTTTVTLDSTQQVCSITADCTTCSQ